MRQGVAHWQMEQVEEGGRLDPQSDNSHRPL